MKESLDISADKPLTMGLLVRGFGWRLGITWLVVFLEIFLLALLPLFLGKAIDALLASDQGALWELAALMGGLILLSVGRRYYDTRVFGSMRVWLGEAVVKRNVDQPVSSVNARLDMSLEMVSFLEEYVPGFMTAAVQLVVCIGILWHLNVNLGICALGVMLVIATIYGLFHRRFYRLNSQLNSQREKQVSILELRKHKPILDHLKMLRRHEIKLSDSDALLYGLIFTAMFSFILINLRIASMMAGITTGTIFVVLSYSWELVESGITFPAVLQQWSRLEEIKDRINMASVTPEENPEDPQG